MYLKGEKSLHFSSCKYVREKITLPHTSLKTAQLYLSKSKHVTFFPEENVEESYQISTIWSCASMIVPLSKRP